MWDGQVVGSGVLCATCEGTESVSLYRIARGGSRTRSCGTEHSSSHLEILQAATWSSLFYYPPACIIHARSYQWEKLLVTLGREHHARRDVVSFPRPYHPRSASATTQNVWDSSPGQRRVKLEVGGALRDRQGGREVGSMKFRRGVVCPPPSSRL